MRIRSHHSKCAFIAGAGLVLALNGASAVTAQAPSAPPASNSPNPATPVNPPAAAASGTQTLTLQQVVALAVSNNSAVILAHQRLQKAEDQIKATTAQAYPQVNASIVDSYSSQKTFGTSGGSAVNPALPGGGQIPTIIDQGGGTTSTFVGGGGGGTALGTGTVTSTSAATVPVNSTGSGTGTTGVGTGTSTGTGASGGTGATGTTGTGGVGTGVSTGAAISRVTIAPLPPIEQQYAAAVGVPVSKAGQVPSGIAQGHAAGHAPPTTTTTPITGTTTSGNTFFTGNSGNNNNYGGHISVTQYIDLFGLVHDALNVENMTRDFYQLDLRRIKNETALSSKEDFFTVLRDQAQIGVDQEQVKAAAENLHFTLVQYAAGTAAYSLVLSAEVTLSNDQQTLTSDQNILNLASANLDNLLGLPAATRIVLQTPPVPPFSDTVDLQKSTQIALTQRPEIQQANNNIYIAKELIRLAGAPLLPSLGISGNANYNATGQAGVPKQDYTVSVQLNIPIFDGGYAHAQIESAKVDLQTQDTTRAQLRQNIMLEVRQSYLNILNDQARGASSALGTTEAREAARIARLQYQYGTNTFLNVLNAEAQLATAETDQLNADYSYQTDLAALVRDIGGR